jgi:uncharacterized RDD family membrane protein YckC
MPYQAMPTRNFASFGARLGGYLLDQLLYGLVFALFLIPAIILGYQSVKDCTRTNDGNGTTKISCTGDQLHGGLLAGAIALGAIGIIVVAVIYLRALGRTGQTWGRKIVGVRVVRKDSTEPLGVGLALGRSLLEALLSGNCVIGYLWMLWDKDKQTWHDKIVNTVVEKV